MKKVFLAMSMVVLLSGCVMPDKTDKPLKTTIDGGGAANEPASSTASAPAYTPKPADFVLEVIETEKNCFGSAGCNVTFIVDPSYTGQALDPQQSYTVIYNLVGGQATETGSFTVQGTQYEKPDKDTISTDSSGTVLQATVTRIVED